MQAVAPIKTAHGSDGVVEQRRAAQCLLLGIAALGASFGMKALLQQGTTYIGYLGILVLVIPAFTWVRAKLKK